MNSDTEGHATCMETLARDEMHRRIALFSPPIAASEGTPQAAGDRRHVSPLVRSPCPLTTSRPHFRIREPALSGFPRRARSPVDPRTPNPRPARDEFGDEPPLKLRVKGLRYMNDDPSVVDVLYACVEEVGSRCARSAVARRITRLQQRLVWFDSAVMRFAAPRSGRLERIGEAVVKAFSEEGLLLPKARDVRSFILRSAVGFSFKPKR